MTTSKKEYVFDKWYKSLTKEEKDNLYNDCRSETKRVLKSAFLFYSFINCIVNKDVR